MTAPKHQTQLLAMCLKQPTHAVPALCYQEGVTSLLQPELVQFLTDWHSFIGHTKEGQADLLT